MSTPPSIHELTMSLAKAQLRQEREQTRLQEIIDNQAEQILNLSEQHAADQRTLAEFSDELQEIGEHHTKNYEVQEMKLKELLMENSHLHSENADLQQQLLLRGKSHHSCTRSASRRTASLSPQRERSFRAGSQPSQYADGSSPQVQQSKSESSAPRSDPDGGEAREITSLPPPPSTLNDSQLVVVESEGEFDASSSPSSTSSGTAMDTLQLALVSQQLKDAEIEIESLKAKLELNEKLNKQLEDKLNDDSSEDEKSRKLASMIVLCSEREIELDDVATKYNKLEEETQRRVAAAESSAFEASHKVKQQLREEQAKTGALEFQLERLQFEYDSWKKSAGPESVRYNRRNVACGGNEILYALGGEEDCHVSPTRDSAGTIVTSDTLVSATEELAAVREVRRQEREHADARCAQLEEQLHARLRELEEKVVGQDQKLASAQQDYQQMTKENDLHKHLVKNMGLRVQEEHDKRMLESEALRTELQKSELQVVRAQAAENATRDEVAAVQKEAEEKLKEVRDAHNIEVSTLKLSLSSATLPVKQLEARLKVASSELERAKNTAKEERRNAAEWKTKVEDLERDMSRLNAHTVDVSQQLHETSRRLDTTSDLLKESEDNSRKQIVDLSSQLRATHERQAANSYQQDRQVVPLSAFRDQQLEVKRMRQSINDAATITEMILEEVSPSSVSGNSRSLMAPTPLSLTVTMAATTPDEEPGLTRQYGSFNQQQPRHSRGWTPDTPSGQNIHGFTSPWTATSTMSAGFVQDGKATPIGASQRLVQLSKDVLNSVRTSRGRPPMTVFPSPTPGGDQTVRRNATRLSPSDETDGGQTIDRKPQLSEVDFDSTNRKEDKEAGDAPNDNKEGKVTPSDKYENDISTGSEERKLHFDDALSPQAESSAMMSEQQPPPPQAEPSSPAQVGTPQQ